MKFTKYIKNNDKTRINLLPPADKARFEKNKKRIIISLMFALFLFFIFLLDFAAYYENSSKRSQILNLRQRYMVDKNKNIISGTLISTIENKKKLEEAIEKKISVINNLKKLKIDWNKKIGAIINASPKGVWMSGFLLQKGVVLIDGNSVSLNGLSLYIERLKKTNIFRKVAVQNINRKIIGGNTFYAFTLKGYLPYYESALSKNRKK